MKNIEEQREREIEKVDLRETLFPLNSNCGSGYKYLKTSDLSTQYNKIYSSLFFFSSINSSL